MSVEGKKFSQTNFGTDLNNWKDRMLKKLRRDNPSKNPSATTITPVERIKSPIAKQDTKLGAKKKRKSRATEERLRTVPLIFLKEADINNEEDRQALEKYVNIINDPRNILHFSHPPSSIEKMIKRCSKPSAHPLIVKDSENNMVAGAVIDDADTNQHDHFINMFVVDADRQGQGFGKQALIQIINWGFKNKAPVIDENGQVAGYRPRIKLDIAIIQGIQGWRKMHDIVNQLSFRPVHVLARQVDIRRSNGRIEKKSAERWEMTKNYWEGFKNVLPQPPKSL